MNKFGMRIAVLASGLFASSAISGPTWAAGPEVPPVSSFAPADDLIGQVGYFVGRIEESLASPAAYDLAKRSRTHKDANTLSALCLVLAMHDRPHALTGAAPAMLRSTQELAQAGDDYERAKQAFAAFKAARDSTTPAAEAVQWQSVADLSALMKQVPLIHSHLKRGVEGNRLTRQAAQSAGQAAALAAIAQATMLDTELLKTPADAERWRQFCVQMRDAAGEINSAVHAQDAARVTASMTRLHQSCEDCHAVFRRP